MRNRPDAQANPGGDTVLMTRLREELIRLGHHVEIDLTLSANVGAFDALHLFNLTLPQLLGPLSEDALSKGVPFLIHALLEDWPRYLNRSQAAALVLERYVASGQPRALLEDMLALTRDCPAAEIPACPGAAGAAAIVCTGSQEVEAVGWAVPGAKSVVVPLGSDLLNATQPGAETASEGDDPRAFRVAFGLEDFVLCVGRLEYRKNQLMLLAAMELDDLPLVFADGGFAYAAEYADACRKFKRKGRTVFTGRLSPALLRSAYRGARVHCLPSWFELPGLVSLEAALWTPQVVAGAWGTLEDYLGGHCRFVEPDDVPGLRRAVLEAWNAPPDPGLARAAAAFTWERTARAMVAIYLEMANRR